MSISINKQQLFDLAQNTNTEMRLVQGGGDVAPEIETREGTWHGRLMRQIKAKEPSIDRSDKQIEYGGFHQSVRESLKEIYGEAIAEKAFRAGGLGSEDQRGNWRTDADFPLTGRHIAKMLETAEREVVRNAGIAGWIGTINQQPEGEAPNVLLGAKVSVPHGHIGLDEAIDHLAADLGEDVERWQGEGARERHGFWILDLGLQGGGRERIGIHVDRNDPNLLHIRGTDGDYNVNKSDLAAWFRAYAPEHLPAKLTQTALHRAELDTASRVVEQGRAILRGPMRDVIDWGNPGVRNWTTNALTEIDSSSKLLRSHTSIPRDTRGLKEDVDLQLSKINGLLQASDSVLHEQRHRDERQAFFDHFVPTVAEPLQQYGMEPKQRVDIARALMNEALSYFGSMRAERRSLTEDDVRNRLLDRFNTMLPRLLAEANVPEDTRDELRAKLLTQLVDWLTDLNDTKLVPMQVRLDETIEPLHNQITRELEVQRSSFEAKSQELKELVGVQVEMKDVPTNRILMPENSLRQGDPIEWHSDATLHDVAPIHLLFRQQGDDVIASVPRLFSGRNWDKVVGDSASRFSGDKSGVPGRGHDGDMSPRLTKCMDSMNLTIKVGGQDPERLTVETRDFCLANLEGPDGAPLQLSREQQCGLSRFLGDEAFQDMYAHTVKRLCPPDTLADCRDVSIYVGMSLDENHQPVFDISFRAPLPDGEDLRYQSVDGNGVISGDVHELDQGNLQLTTTLHVPMDQLQASLPKVTWDRPVIVFPEVPDDR